MSSGRPENAPFGYSSRSGGHSQPRSASPSASGSPVDSSIRSPFSLSAGPGVTSAGIMAGNPRSGAGSPSHDMTGAGRLFSKRAREIQAQEGVPGIPLNPWGGPPTSGNSTPLRGNIPESPTDGFPGFALLPTPDSMPHTRRARAGTLPSRFSPTGVGVGSSGATGFASQSVRQTPSQSPFNQSPSPRLEPVDSTPGSSTLLSRLRAGSLPQRSQFAAVSGSNSPFGPSVFSSWNLPGVGRERGSTLASIASVGSNGPSSPAQSQFSKEGGGESDVHMRTLDYLGLAETPQPPRAQLATPYMPSTDFSGQSSRFRSYSVNNKDKYADEDDYEDADGLAAENHYVAAALQKQLDDTHAQIRSHNLAVQAFANQASVNRPRARTAGVLDTPGSRLMKTYMAGGTGAPSPLAMGDVPFHDEKEFEDLPQAVAGMNLGTSNSRSAGLLSAEDQGLEGPTSALWLGSIPTSTTTSTLTEMFKPHGVVSSARVLTHKNCGFVNFERVESAISAKASMSGKEIFPGAGPIRINFAKPPSSSNTPGPDGAYPSPSPDPLSRGVDGATPGLSGTGSADASAVALAASAVPSVPPLSEMSGDMLEIVKHFGATDVDVGRISQSLRCAIEYDGFADEIPPVRDPTHTRIHDAPRLRDIRKRIDNGSMSGTEIENVATEMLPEIAELSSDYLGNTVVQKLFEYQSDDLRDAMLKEIAPHLAEIGVHKNGTWAAQKIIGECKTSSQMATIVEHLRPYTVPLFLDQYGNYVLQGCLKFGAPYNDFIFETILSRMWEIAQGRFGARATRACLESHFATQDQQRMLAAAIAMHSVQLATNANGALLLTWFLDTCTFPQRRTVLSPRLVPHLVHLCTHKVAYMTVLKVINQKTEPEARDILLKALFFAPNDQVLEAILNDHACGATLIFKVLTTPFIGDDTVRSQVLEKVKNVLIRIKAQPSHGYKRLMDEVGLATRNTLPNSRENSSHPDQRQRPNSKHANTNGHHSNQQNKAFYNPLNPTTSQPAYDMGYGTQRPDMDPNVTAFPAYNQAMMFNPSGSPVPSAMNMQPMHPQQTMMNRGPQMAYSMAPMQPTYPAYNAPSPAMDQYRQANTQNGSPSQPPPGNLPPMSGPPLPFAPPGFAMGMGGYGYPNVQGMQNMGYMHPEQLHNRRGRR